MEYLTKEIETIKLKDFIKCKKYYIEYDIKRGLGDIIAYSNEFKDFLEEIVLYEHLIDTEKYNFSLTLGGGDLFQKGFDIYKRNDNEIAKFINIDNLDKIISEIQTSTRDNCCCGHETALDGDELEAEIYNASLKIIELSRAFFNYKSFKDVCELYEKENDKITNRLNELNDYLSNSVGEKIVLGQNQIIQNALLQFAVGSISKSEFLELANEQVLTEEQLKEISEKNKEFNEQKKKIIEVVKKFSGKIPVGKGLEELEKD